MARASVKDKLPKLRYPDAWTTLDQPRDTYFTTAELAKKVSTSQRQIYRWCETWFGQIPLEKRAGGSVRGPGKGIRIPLAYEYVARGWQQTQDKTTRRAMQRALVQSPKDYVVVVGTASTTCYDLQQVAGVTAIALVKYPGKPVHIYYVGAKNAA